MPNAIANMQAFTSKYPPSPTAFFVISAIGSIAIKLGKQYLDNSFHEFSLLVISSRKV